MRIRCPRCDTLYRQPASAARDVPVTFRCARCGHEFEGAPEEPEVIEGFDVDVDTDEPVELGDAVDEAAEPSRSRDATAARFAIRSLLAVTLGYAMLSLWAYTYPAALRDALRRLPILGPVLVQSRISPASIRLTDVHGTYQRIKGDQVVFVVSGTAVNAAPVVVRSIRIETALTGETSQEQSVYCGAIPRRVTELSAREIALLQRLEPPKNWRLRPGESAPFLVVFTDPPKDLRQLTARVVAVQAPIRAERG